MRVGNEKEKSLRPREEAKGVDPKLGGSEGDACLILAAEFRVREIEGTALDDSLVDIALY